MFEIVAVTMLSSTAALLPLQLIGCVSPYWVCERNEDYFPIMPNNTCNGLFYSVSKTTSEVKLNVLDNVTPWLTLSTLVISIVTTVILMRIFHRRLVVEPEIKWELAVNNETVIYFLFWVGQIPAGVAFFLLLSKSFEWSAILFNTMSFPILIVGGLVFVIICMIRNWKKDAVMCSSPS